MTPTRLNFAGVPGAAYPRSQWTFSGAASAGAAASDSSAAASTRGLITGAQ